jgi:hypothetical protein
VTREAIAYEILLEMRRIRLRMSWFDRLRARAASFLLGVVLPRRLRVLYCTSVALTDEDFVRKVIATGEDTLS